MKPVFQTVFDDLRGNCLSASLASILELDVNDVPNFDVHNGDFIVRVNEWLKPFGLFWLRVIMPRLHRGADKVDVGREPESSDEFSYHPIPDGVLCLATGKSPRSETYHSVVGITENNGFKLVHDPHPDGLGIEGLPICLEFLVPLNPTMRY